MPALKNAIARAKLGDQANPPATEVELEIWRNYQALEEKVRSKVVGSCGVDLAEVSPSPSQCVQTWLENVDVLNLISALFFQVRGMSPSNALQGRWKRKWLRHIADANTPPTSLQPPHGPGLSLDPENLDGVCVLM